MSAGAEAALRHRHASTFRQHALLESHGWQRPVLGGAPLSAEEAGAIQCLQFDSGGELLVAGSEEGLITVHAAAALAAARAFGSSSSSGGDGDSGAWRQQQLQPAAADPLLVLDCHMPKLQAVRWNGADENVVGVASSATRQLHLYDLQHTQVG